MRPANHSPLYFCVFFLLFLLFFNWTWLILDIELLRATQLHHTRQTMFWFKQLCPNKTFSLFVLFCFAFCFVREQKKTACIVFTKKFFNYLMLTFVCRKPSVRSVCVCERKYACPFFFHLLRFSVYGIVIGKHFSVIFNYLFCKNLNLFERIGIEY